VKGEIRRKEYVNECYEDSPFVEKITNTDRVVISKKKNALEKEAMCL